MYIHCICADWCDTCRDFHDIFEQAANRHTEHAFFWHILEDLEERFSGIEVDNFPMLLVTNHQGLPRFAGPILPNAAALQHIIAACEGDMPLSRAQALLAWNEIAHALARDDVQSGCRQDK